MGRLLLALFGLPFLGVGLWMTFQGIQILRAARPGFIPLFFTWMIALPFSFIGLVLVAIAFLGKEVSPGTESPLATRKRLMGIKSSSEEWQEGRLTSSGVGAILSAWALATAATLFVAPFLWVVLTHGALYRPWIIVTLLPIGACAVALYRSLRRRKFGRSICEIHRKPSTTSDELALLIRPEGFELPAGEALITLQCEKREYRDTGEHRYLNKATLWREEKRISVPVAGFGIQTTFLVPPSLPNADHKGPEGIFWILTAKSQTPGINYFSEFDMAFKR